MRTFVMLIAACLTPAVAVWADDEIPVVPGVIVGDPCDEDSEFRTIELESDGTASGWWALLSRPEVMTFFCDRESVISLDVSPDGRFAVAGDLDGMVRVWDLTRGEEVVEHRPHTSHVLTAGFLPDDELTLIRCFEGSRALRAAFTKDGASFTAFCEGYRLKTWNTATGAVLADLALPSFTWAVEPLADGNHVLVTKDVAEISVIDLATGEVIRRLDIMSADWVEDILVSPDGHLVVGATDQGFMAWEIDGGQVVTLAAKKVSRSINVAQFDDACPRVHRED